MILKGIPKVFVIESRIITKAFVAMLPKAKGYLGLSTIKFLSCMGPNIITVDQQPNLIPLTSYYGQQILLPMTVVGEKDL